MRVVCLGDSLTFGYGVKSRDNWVSLLNERQLGEFINMGIPGDTTEDMRRRFTEDVIACRPAHVFIMGGTNDLFLQVGVDAIIYNIADMVRMSQIANIHPTILLPAPIIGEVKAKQLFVDADYKAVSRSLQEYRQQLKKYALENTVWHIDVLEALKGADKITDWYLEDGIHITPGFHRKIAALIAVKLSKQRII